MKHLTIITFIAVLLVGCGEESPRITGDYDVLVQKSERSLWIGEVFARQIVTQYRSVVAVDTNSVYIFDLRGRLRREYDERAAIRLIYETDSVTYDTICYERKECGE